MPNNVFSCQHHKKWQKMPNHDVHAKHHFFMPNHFEKGQISGICPWNSQPGNPGQWCHTSMIELPNYVVTMKRFHWGTDIGCLPSQPNHCSCMSDQLVMWHNAAYSVYYTQPEVSARPGNARAYIRRSTLLSVYKNYTVADMKLTELT